MRKCSCWATSDNTLPHQEDCPAASTDSRWWLLLARLVMELLRRPTTQVTVQRGKSDKRFQTLQEQRLITLRFLLDEDALDRAWPAKTTDEEVQTTEALSLAMAEKAAALMAGRDELRLPPTQEEVEGAIAVAYRAYVAIRDSRRETEPAAFATAFRSLLAAANARQLANWRPPSEDERLLRADGRRIEHLCKTVLRDGESGVMNPSWAAARDLARVVLQDRGVDVTSDEFWRRLGLRAPRVPAEIMQDPYQPDRCTCPQYCLMHDV